MDGDTLNGYFERGFFGKSEIQKLAAIPGWSELGKPSQTPIPVADTIVSEQHHRIDATWADESKTLTLSKNSVDGKGLWIPYLGNGYPVTADSRGIGTYTRNIGGALDNASWVATGPFSGCHVAVFTSGTDKVFAHVITPAHNHPCATVDEQMEELRTRVGVEGNNWKVPAVGGLGYVFFTKINGTWYVRTSEFSQGGVKVTIGKKSSV